MRNRQPKHQKLLSLYYKKYEFFPLACSTLNENVNLLLVYRPRAKKRNRSYVVPRSTRTIRFDDHDHEDLPSKVQNVCFLYKARMCAKLWAKPKGWTTSSIPLNDSQHVVTRLLHTDVMLPKLNHTQKQCVDVCWFSRLFAKCGAYTSGVLVGIINSVQNSRHFFQEVVAAM